MEISLPDEKGRVQILKIHTAKMAKNGLMDPGVNLLELAQVTKNYSGAEIEGLVKAASSFALNREVNPNNLSKVPDASKIKVTRADFQAALSETKPAFGASKDSLEQYRPNGLIAYGPRWDKLTATASLYIAQTLNSARSPVTSLLLEGRAGCGKTALAISLALSGEFPYLKLISPDDLVGYGESAKCSKIQKVFDDAYKSKVSCVVVDDLERLIEYVPVGPRFSNTILQMLLVLLKKAPPPGYRMLVIATATSAKVMEELELFDCFTGSLNVPLITEGTELKAILAELDKGFSARDLDEVARNYTEPLPIKKLISLLEMTRQMHTTQPTQPLSSLFVSSLQEAGVAHAAKAAGF
jgi:vesicle-fusing ATPase